MSSGENNFSKKNESPSVLSNSSNQPLGDQVRLMNDLLQEEKASYWYKLALVEKVNGNWNKALNYINRAIQINKRIGQAYLLRALFSAKTGVIKNAIEDIEYYYNEFYTQIYFLKEAGHKPLDLEELWDLYDLLFYPTKVDGDKESILTFKEKHLIMKELNIDFSNLGFEAIDQVTFVRKIILQIIGLFELNHPSDNLIESAERDRYFKWNLLWSFESELSAKQSALEYLNEKIINPEEAINYSELDKMREDTIKGIKDISTKISDTLLKSYSDFSPAYLLKFRCLSTYQGWRQVSSAPIGNVTEQFDCLETLLNYNKVDELFIVSHLFKCFWFYTKEAYHECLPWIHWMPVLEKFHDDVKSGHYKEEIEIYGAETLGMNIEELEEYKHRQKNYYLRLACELLLAERIEEAYNTCTQILANKWRYDRYQTEDLYKIVMNVCVKNGKPEYVAKFKEIHSNITLS